MTRKLQVFVSSTFVDMQVERQAAVEAILQGGHLPAGMELFTAGDESQLEAILRWIESSDVLLVLLGERYGSIDPKSKKSYTQVEYEHALNLGKKVFGLVLSQEAVKLKYKELGSDATDGHRAEHAAFKSLIMSKLCREVTDTKDIKIEVSRSMHEFSWDDSLIGWVRADEFVRAQKLVSELQTTVTELRNKPHQMGPNVAELQREFEIRIEELRMIDVSTTLRAKRPGDAEYMAYVLEGNALGFLWWIRKILRSQQVRGYEPYAMHFRSVVGPYLEVWDFCRITGANAIVPTAKGELLLAYLDKGTKEDFGTITFTRAMSEPQVQWCYLGLPGVRAHIASILRRCIECDPPRRGQVVHGVRKSAFKAHFSDRTFECIVSQLVHSG